MKKYIIVGILFFLILFGIFTFSRDSIKDNIVLLTSNKTLLISIISALVSVITLLINLWLQYNLNKQFEKDKRSFDKKFESYSELISLTKPFLSDPGLSYKDAKNFSKRFIEKYNDEILPFAPKEVVEAVQNFLYNSGTKYANENILTKSLISIIQAIRKDLGLTKLDGNNIEFHAVNEDGLKNIYTNKTKLKSNKIK